MAETSITNLTAYEEEMLEDFNPEYETYLHLSETVQIVTIITNFIKLLLCLVVLAADIFLIVIICRNAKLKCQTNSYLIHYAVFNILVILVTPLFYTLIELFHVDSIGFIFLYYCIYTQIETTSLSMCFLVGVCMSIDWLFNVYNPELKNKMEGIYQYSIIVAYAIAVFKMVFTLAECFSIGKRSWFLSYFYVSILTFNIFINVLHYRRGPAPHDRSYSLVAANIIILSWFPMFIYEILWVSVRGSLLLEYILTLISFIPEWIGYGSPILLLFVLGKMNKRFKRVYIRTFNRRANDYNDDMDESSDGKDTEENVTIPPDIQVL